MALEDREFPTTSAGYRDATSWLAGQGALTGGWRRGHQQLWGGYRRCAVRTAASSVVEVNRTRPGGAAQAGQERPARRLPRRPRGRVRRSRPPTPSGPPSNRCAPSCIARRSALKAQQAAWRQIGAHPDQRPSRSSVTGTAPCPQPTLLATLAATPAPAQLVDPDDADTLFALRTLARRHHDLTDRDRRRSRHRPAQPGPTAANPALLAIKGVGPIIGTQLLCRGSCRGS